MSESGRAARLVVTVSEADRWHGRSVASALLDLFRHRGLAGAVVTRGIAGYRGTEPLGSFDQVDVSAALPLRIEVVDTPERIDAVLPDVYDIVEDGQIEIQESRLVKAGPAPRRAEPRKEELVRLVGKAKALSIYVGQDDRWEGAPLYEAIVLRARQLDIAGATVFRGVLGYGAHKRIHKHKALTLSKDDPILVTLVDEETKVNALLSALDRMVTGGCLIVIADATVVRYAEHPDDEAENPAPGSS